MRKQFVKRDELKIKMIRMGMSAQDVAKALETSRQSFYKKLDGSVEFNENDLCVLKTLFGTGIFF